MKIQIYSTLHKTNLAGEVVSLRSQTHHLQEENKSTKKQIAKKHKTRCLKFKKRPQLREMIIKNLYHRLGDSIQKKKQAI